MRGRRRFGSSSPIHPFSPSRRPGRVAALLMSSSAGCLRKPSTNLVSILVRRGDSENRLPGNPRDSVPDYRGLGSQTAPGDTAAWACGGLDIAIGAKRQVADAAARAEAKADHRMLE
jgi:hypothetical protein